MIGIKISAVVQRGGIEYGQRMVLVPQLFSFFSHSGSTLGLQLMHLHSTIKASSKSLIQDRHC